MTETLSITIEEARALLVEAVEEKGEGYVYPGSLNAEQASCWYGDYPAGEPTDYATDTANPCNGPGCIVGHVLVKKGLTIDELRPFEGQSALHVIGTLTGTGTGYLQTDLLPVSRALAAAQQAQDEGRTWGEALAKFDEMAADLAEVSL